MGDGNRERRNNFFYLLSCFQTIVFFLFSFFFCFLFCLEKEQRERERERERERGDGEKITNKKQNNSTNQPNKAKDGDRKTTTTI